MKKFTLEIELRHDTLYLDLGKTLIRVAGELHPVWALAPVVGETKPITDISGDQVGTWKVTETHPCTHCHGVGETERVATPTPFTWIRAHRPWCWLSTRSQ